MEPITEESESELECGEERLSLPMHFSTPKSRKWCVIQVHTCMSGITLLKIVERTCMCFYNLRLMIQFIHRSLKKATLKLRLRKCECCLKKLCIMYSTVLMITVGHRTISGQFHCVFVQ